MSNLAALEGGIAGVSVCRGSGRSQPVPRAPEPVSGASPDNISNADKLLEPFLVNLIVLCLTLGSLR
jgi:hypothetical protein